MTAPARFPRAFLWFHDTAAPSADASLRQRLAHVAPGGVESVVIQSGPSNARGLLMAPAGIIEQGMEFLRYDATAQDWFPAPGGLWVGYWKNGKPGPRDLVCPRIPAGLQVVETELGDGNEWAIPVLVDRDGMPCLPSSYVENTEGNLAQRTVPDLAFLDQWAGRFSESITAARDGNDGAVMSNSEIYRATVAALSALYRVGSPEVSALQLFDQRCLPAILGAFRGISFAELQAVSDA